MIEFKGYSRIRQGQCIGEFFLYSPDELFNDVEGKEYIELYGGFSVLNFRDQGLVAEKSPFDDGIGVGGLYLEDLKSDLGGYFKIDDSPRVSRTAWFKTKEGAKRFLDKYGKIDPEGEHIGLWAPTTMIFNE
jgi:hypothetical protein